MVGGYEEPEKSYVLKAQSFADGENSDVNSGTTWYNQKCYNADIDTLVDTLGENPTSLAGMFSSEDCSALTDINFSADLSNISSFDNMFSGCTNVKNITIKNTDSTQSVIDISNLFKNLPNLESVTLEGFNITGLESAFVGCSKIKNVKLTGGTVTGSANSMFNGCSTLEEVYIMDNTSNSVYDVSNMFNDCSNLKKVKLTGFESTALDWNNLLNSTDNDLTDVEISGDLSSLTTFKSILNSDNAVANSAHSTSLQKLSLTNTNLSGTTAITTGEGYFQNWTTLTDVTLNNFKNSNAMSLQNIFSGCSSLANITIKNSGDVNNIIGIFSSCSSLKTVDLEVTSWTTSDFYNTNLFYQKSSLQSVKLRGDMSRVSSIQQLFWGCTDLKTIDAENVNLGSNITNNINLRGLYYGCSSLTSATLLNGADMTYCENLYQVFEGCNLTSDQIKAIIATWTFSSASPILSKSDAAYRNTKAGSKLDGSIPCANGTLTFNNGVLAQNGFTPST